MWSFCRDPTHDDEAVMNGAPISRFGAEERGFKRFLSVDLCTNPWSKAKRRITKNFRSASYSASAGCDLGDNRQLPSSLRALEWTNFFVADVQTGVGPFLAAYLASREWNPRDVGLVLTLGGIVGVVLGPFAGAIVDRTRSKRGLLAIAVGVLAAGAVLILSGAKISYVAAAQVLIGAAGAFLLPTLAAVTLGMVGAKGFGKQFGRNQGFNSAGNVFTALLLGGVSYMLGARSIFVAAAMLTAPALFAISRIDGDLIDFNQARGQIDKKGIPGNRDGRSPLRALFGNRVLRLFLLCAFLFHLANAAMLPQLGEMLAKGKPKTAEPFMAACIIVTQLVISCTAAWIGRKASSIGRRPLLLVGFGVLPVRAVLYTVTHVTGALIAIQVLDGVANSIFAVVSILLISDLMRGTGSFNFGQGALGTMVGLGAALSTTLGGLLIHRFGFSASFLGLGAVAAVAFTVLWFGVPETLPERQEESVATANT